MLDHWGIKSHNESWTSTVKSDRFFLVVQNFMISITYPPPRIPVTNEGLFWDSQSPNDVLPRKLPYYLPEKWLLEVIEDEFLRRKKVFCFFRKSEFVNDGICHLGGREIELAYCRSHKSHGVFGLAVLLLEVGNHSHLYFSGCGTRFGRTGWKKTCFCFQRLLNHLGLMGHQVEIFGTFGWTVHHFPQFFDE